MNGRERGESPRGPLMRTGASIVFVLFILACPILCQVTVILISFVHLQSWFVRSFLPQSTSWAALARPQDENQSDSASPSINSSHPSPGKGVVRSPS